LNEGLLHYKTACLQHLLSSLECRLRIIEVNSRTVRSNESIIRLLELHSGQIRFLSGLRLPCLAGVTYSLQLQLDAELLEVRGELTDSKELCGELRQYALKCALPEDDHLRLYQWVNGRMGELMHRWYGPYGLCKKVASSARLSVAVKL
jgi:hypothetical protein